MVLWGRLNTMRRVSLIVALLAWVSGGAAQSTDGGSRTEERSARVFGVVSGSDGSIPGAHVRAMPGGGSTMVDSAGRFSLALSPGAYDLRVTSLGHRPWERRIRVSDGEALRLDVVLSVSAVALDPVVVTGTLRERRVAESPVKVDVVSGARLRQRLVSSVMESIDLVNGLSRRIECGVCYTDNIRINGMEGPYTAVLIDGMPIMSSLASVYGLSGINPLLIERLEVVKGPSSTLYGSEAMGGVVNVITRDPRLAP
ncbi:MAG TPA: TonB-dependent receptor plug domain-containing protein, partial [Longimicrobiales bacterium]|nr:TonB-dependent receptor plug domain-containing protein [Longimicrobiales bacterium]